MKVVCAYRMLESVERLPQRLAHARLFEPHYLRAEQHLWYAEPLRLHYQQLYTE